MMSDKNAIGLIAEADGILFYRHDQNVPFLGHGFSYNMSVTKNEKRGIQL